MAIIRRRPLPAAPVQVLLDMDKIRAKPKMKRPGGKSNLDELRAKLAEAVPVDPERNSDGSNYVETINRYAAKVRNPLTAIRAKCVECSGGSLKEVTECRVIKCALYPFRMGTNPMHKKTRDRLAGDAPGQDEGDEESGDES